MTAPLLLPHHQALLDQSGVSPEVAGARGYRSVTSKAELERLGFSRSQLLVPTLLIPVWSVTGELASYQHRPDQPRVVDGKPLKYETPKGSRMLLDVHPSARPKLGDPSVPLFVTEGVRKADAAVSRGLCCIALLGVWNWRGSNEHGGKTALPDWEHVALNGRRTYIVYDSDVMLKPQVHQALARLKAFLEQRGADVALIYLPAGGGGTKTGIDDFLTSGHTIDDLLALATTELRGPVEGDVDPDHVRVGEYRTDGRTISRLKHTQDGDIPVALCNFSARIVEEVVQDNGAERKTVLRVSGRLYDGSPLPTVDVPAENYPGMGWVTGAWGSRPVVYAGQGTKDHLRAAIQLLSGDVPRRTVFAHTGWRQLDGEWVYLHAGGAIGIHGPVPGVEVDLDDSLAGMVLPDPPQGDALREAVQASLRILDVAPPELTVPLLAATYRAPLCEVLPADYSLFYAGRTGVKKTSLTALAQAHFGPSYNDRKLPTSWTSTANSLELLAFTAKDSVLVVDDFAPRGEARDVNRLHREADRILRAQGNRAGRGRMRPDGSLRPVYVPRGILLSSGEDVPTGESLRARMFVVNVGPDDVDLEALTRSQRDAADGLLAQAMAGYVRWLAPQVDRLRDLLQQRKLELRSALRKEKWAHDRTPDILASLLLGWDAFLGYGVSVGAIANEEREPLWRAGFEAMREKAHEQASYIADEDPVTRFLHLLQSLLDSGRAYLADADAEEDETPARGERIGWKTAEHLYLDPDLAYAHVQRLAREQGTSLPVTPRTLWRRMHERGLLEVERDQNQVYYAPKRTVCGKRRRVVVLPHTNIEALSSHNMGNMGDMGGSPSDAGFQPRFAPMLAPETWAADTENMGSSSEQAVFSAHVSAGECPCPETEHGQKTSPQTLDTTGSAHVAHEAHVFGDETPSNGERVHTPRMGRRKKQEAQQGLLIVTPPVVVDPAALDDPSVRAFAERWNVRPGELPKGVFVIRSDAELPPIKRKPAEAQETTEGERSA